METTAMNDKTVEPTEEMVFSIIGDRAVFWKGIMAHLYDNHKYISEVWKFYNDGKSWLFRTLQKKKTIFWIQVLDDGFHVSFYFGDKLEPFILESDLPESIKNEFVNAKRYNKIRPISIDIKDSDDFENVKILAEIKLAH